MPKKLRHIAVDRKLWADLQFLLKRVFEAAMRFKILLSLLLSIPFFYGPHLDAGYTLKKGRIINVDLLARYSAQEHFAMGCTAMEAEDWKEALGHFRIIIANFPATPYGQESHHYAGICYYHLNEFDFANESLTTYLKVQSHPRFFQETVEWKYEIAQQLAQGAKRRCFGKKRLPKWACGKAMALKIYDEVVAAVPSNDIAAQALVAKGSLLWQLRDFRPCVEAFQLVIRRFPKHELTPECYLYISRVFVAQCMVEFQNPDILAFAQINMRKFKQDFPREERLGEVEANVQMIKEIYARGLYDTGFFYERTHKPCASIIYYRNVIHQFPDTCIATWCRDRLLCLDPSFEENEEKAAADDSKEGEAGSDFFLDDTNMLGL